MCGLSFLVLWIIGLFFNFFPWFIVAWLLHILIDIPTHKRAFFAPQFLTPLSHFNVDGISWGTKWFMLLNYGSIAVFLVLRLTGHLGTLG